MNPLRTIKLSVKVAQNVYFKHFPFLLYLKPTARCDCRCKTCNRWQNSNLSKEEIDINAVKKLLEKFSQAGFTVFTLWGGEPLLRKDAPEILQYAKNSGFRTSMCTNCNLLSKRAEEVIPLVDVLLCSFDGYAKTHDELRGVRGLFERAVRGIEEAKKVNPDCDIKIWASIHKKNIGEIEKIVILSSYLKIGIEFFPISPISGYNNELIPSNEEILEAFETIIHLKKQGFPIRNSFHSLKIMRNNSPFVCNFPLISVHINHLGEIYCCEDPAGNPVYKWGKYPHFNPFEIFNSIEFKKVSGGLRKCNSCKLPCIVELSGNISYALYNSFLKTK